MKQETVEEAADNWDYLSFEAGTKWQQERSYSEEDLKKAFEAGGRTCWADVAQTEREPYYYDFEEWFKEFKKK